MKKYSIVFAGSNAVILAYLASRKDLDIQYAFLHQRSGTAPPFVECCRRFEIPFEIVNDSSEVYETLKSSIRADLGIVAGFKFLPEKVFSWPKKGFVNIHPSYLPFYRGANPFYYMLLNDEKEGGVSIHQVTKKIDGGLIFCRTAYPIHFEDNIWDLIQKTDKLALRLLDRYLTQIIRGELKGIDNTGGSYFPPVKERQFIDLGMPALRIYNLVRSQTIYGGCFLKLIDKTICIKSASFRDDEAGPGEIAVVSGDSRNIMLKLSGEAEQRVMP